MPEWLILAAVVFFALRLSRGSCSGWGSEVRRRIEGEAATERDRLRGKKCGPAFLTSGGEGSRTRRSVRVAGRGSPRRHWRERIPAPPSWGDRHGRTERLPRREESPLQALQRRFVDGAITVEEYERELDRLYRKGPLAGV